MNFKNFQQRRDFLKAAASITIGSGLPTLAALNHVAHATGGIQPTQVGLDYKAIVCVFLYGGQDNANILIPYQDGDTAGTAPAASTTEFDRYAHDRSNFSAANPSGDAPTQNNGNLAYTRALLAATALPPTTSNRMSNARNIADERTSAQRSSHRSVLASTAAMWQLATYGTARPGQ